MTSAPGCAGGRSRPAAAFEQARGWFGLAGYQGLALAAVAGLDIALWDALAKAAGLPLARLLGGTLAPVPAYNSNGLGLIPPAAAGDEALELLAEGGFTRAEGPGRAGQPGRRRRRGPPGPGGGRRRGHPGRGLQPGARPWARRWSAAAPWTREGLAWIEEPLRYDDLDGHARLARDIATPVMLGGELLRPARHARRHPGAGLRPGDARPDADRRGDGLAAGGRDRRRGRHPDVVPSVPGGLRPPAAGHAEPAVAGVAGLGPPGAGAPVRGPRPASCTCPMSPATAWSGTRTRWPTTRHSDSSVGGELGVFRSAAGCR